MTSNSKMVSVVLPVYNGEANVAEAIDSILGQTYRNIELIIVNDCSSDGTLKIIERYAREDRRVKIINNVVNLKLPKTLNVGFAEAKGKYLTWTSDDNLYKNSAIEKMVSVLEANPDVDMVYANYANIDVNGNIIYDVCLEEPEGLIIGNVIGACFLYTRDIAKIVGDYDANLYLAEDYDYWIRLYRVGKILHMNENLYYYRKHNNSLTETRKNQIGIQTYRTMEKNFLFLYAVARSRGKVYQMFDQLIIRLGQNDNMAVKRMLLEIEPGYRKYEIEKFYLGQKEIFRKEIKEKIKRTVFGRALQKIKKMLL